MSSPPYEGEVGKGEEVRPHPHPHHPFYGVWGVVGSGKQGTQGGEMSSGLRAAGCALAFEFNQRKSKLRRPEVGAFR